MLGGMTIRAGCRSIYVHVPFCHTICGYCDFYSEVFDRGAAPRLVDALLTELARYADALRGQVDTIFVGGGTPTTLAPADLDRLLRPLRELADSNGRLEFTVEANPATVDAERAAVLAAAGVTRVSIGAQSFIPSELQVLERIHKPEQVEQTLATCRAAGIRDLSVDLIFAVPGQTLAAWRANLETAIGLGTGHLSCYGLTFERGTPLYRQLQAGAVARLDEGLEAEMLDLTIDRLAEAGLQRYEISNYARPGHECRHNLRYWHNESYVGIGPSAAGYVDGLRYKNVPDTAEYAKAVHAGRSPRIEEERLPLDRTARETAMLELRLVAGIERTRFAGRFGRDPADLFAEQIEKFAPLGLLECNAQALFLTRRGLMVADSLIAEFI